MKGFLRSLKEKTVGLTIKDLTEEEKKDLEDREKHIQEVLSNRKCCATCLNYNRYYLRIRKFGEVPYPWGDCLNIKKVPGYKTFLVADTDYCSEYNKNENTFS